MRYENMLSVLNKLTVDCVWSDWKLGDCSVTCGDGLREDHRFKQQEELYGGTPCEGDAKKTETCSAERLCPGKFSKKRI